MNKNNIISLIRNSNNVKSEMLEQTKDYWLMKVYGEFKDMTKTEVGFNQTQIKQLVDIVRTIIREEVPPMVRTIIKEEVPPMVRTIIKEEVPQMIDQKLDPIKKDILEIKKNIEAIKNCPTVKKELNKY